MISCNGEKLVKVGDFTFMKGTSIDDENYTSRWSCYTHASQGCLAKVYTDGDNVTYVKNTHNHLPTEFFV